MLSKHGTLESAILSVLWQLEAKGSYNNTVKDVYESLQNNEEKKAYTTIKSVMDRLFEKKVLLRFGQGRKFFYRTTFSRSEVIFNSLNEIAKRYCDGDIKKLTYFLNEVVNKELVSV